MANDLFYFMRKNRVDLLKYLPPFLSKDSSFKDVQDTLSREHESLRVKLVDLARQFFIDTATYSIVDWEDFVGVKPLTDDMEARRTRVKAKLRGAETMTVANTNNLVRMFTDGKNSYVEELNKPNEIKIVIPVPDHLLYWRELEEALLEFIPAHLDITVEVRRAFFNKLRAGAADVITGTVETFPATPKPSTVQKIRVGQIFRRSGEIIFQANLDDLERFARIHESAIADLLIVDIGIARPGDLQTETVNEKISHKTTIKVGSVFVRQGQIIIKPSDTQIPPGAPSYARTYAGTAETHRGTVEIKPATPKTPTAVLIRVGRVFVRQGQIVIKPSEVQIPDDEELPADGDWIRLYFNFATGRDKPVLLKNPRADLVKGDIYELGEFAQDNVVFKNSRAEGTLGIDRVDLIKGYALSDGSDTDTLPAADKIRLFFDFPDGNDHKIMMRNVRAGITLGELKALSTTATENRLLLNARNEPTTGLRNVALVKNIRVSTGSMSEPVSF